MTPQQLIAHYRIVSKLGEGGMGAVYRATDTKLHRDVAIKVLPDAFRTDGERMARFEREAQVLAALNHPNIATIYGIEQGAIVMEFVAGEELKGPLPVDTVVNYACQIAAGLEAAHGKGIVHRDLKPANIKVTSAGAVKLLDFGLAVQNRFDDGQSSTETLLTERGAVVGTVAYMSPEQARGETVDARSDLWSLGVLLYELVTGVRPFAGPTAAVAFDAILNRAARPVRELNAMAPAGLERILSQLMEKDRTRRYASASLLRQDLERLRDTTVPGNRRRGRYGIVSAAAVVVAAGLFLIWHERAQASLLTDKDTIVLAGFTNHTGDPVFDGTLRQGLTVQLEQSPFLSLLSDERIQATLALMGQPADAPLIPKLAREVCVRTGSKAYLEGSISSLGSQYVLGLSAKRCADGELLDEEQTQARKKEDVLDSLTQIASKFRTKIGESLTTVKQFNTPLEEASTPSLEALKAYTTAQEHLRADDDRPGQRRLYERAIEIDPSFAMAYASLGFVQMLTSQLDAAGSNIRKAYELRGRVSERERLFITAQYHLQVTGDLDKALQVCELWLQTYPREVMPRGLLGAFLYPTFGKFAKGAEMGRQWMSIDPASPVAYLQFAFNSQFNGHLDEAAKTLRDAVERHLEIPDMIQEEFDVAFLKGDSAEMDRLVSRSIGKLGAEDQVAARKGFVLAYTGRLEQARQLARRAAELANQSSQPGRAVLFALAEPLFDALFGNAARAIETASAALKSNRDRDTEYAGALAMGLAGESAKVAGVVKDLEARFPEDTCVRVFYAPELRALIALNGGNANAAIEALRVSEPYDFGTPLSGSPGFFGVLYPVYVRGLAYLKANRGTEAAAEFQKIIEHRMVVVSDPIGALAHLQLGRALAMAGEREKAKAAYRELFKIWAQPDGDVPMVRAARAELAALR